MSVFRAGLEAVKAAGNKAKYADIGRAVNGFKGRKTTSKRSNVYWGRRIALQLLSAGFVEAFVVRGEGSYKHLQDRWRLTPNGAHQVD
jgi:hypothetical protein